MKNKWIILAGCFLGFSIFHANRQLIAILLPCIKEDLKLNYVNSTLLAMSYDLGYLLTLIIVGYLTKYIAKKKAIILGVLIIAFTSLFSGYFSSYNQLIMARIIAGIGFSLYFTSGNSLIADYFPSHEQGKAFGVHTTGSVVGQIYGTLLGGTLAEYLPWSITFGVYGLFCLLVAALIALLFKDKNDKKVLAKSHEVKRINLKALIADIDFRVSSIASAASNSSIMIICTFLPLILNGYKGISLPLTTNLMSLLLFASIISCLTVGALSDHLGARRLMAVLFLATAICCFLIIITGNTTLLIIELLLLGFFFSGSFPITLSLLTGKGGIFSEPFTLGVFFAISILAGLLFTTLAGKVAELFGVIAVLWVAGMIVFIAGIWVAACVKPALFLRSKEDKG